MRLWAIFFSVFVASQVNAETQEQRLYECISEAEEILVFSEVLSVAVNSAFGEELDGQDVAAYMMSWDRDASYRQLLDELIDENISLEEAKRKRDVVDVKRDNKSGLISELVNEGLSKNYGARAKASYVKSCITGFDDTFETQLELIDSLKSKLSLLENALDAAGVERPVEDHAKTDMQSHLLEQIKECWIVVPDSGAASGAVTLYFDLQRDGKVNASSIRMTKFTGTYESDANVAFQSVRRALLRCQKGGYDLPEDQYHIWKQIELTFDPEILRNN